jgi:hypothetical protein
MFLQLMDKPTKGKILAATKTELLRHSWGTYVDEPPKYGGRWKGSGRAGMRNVQEEGEYNDQYMEHLADDVLPVILHTAFKIAEST